MSDTDRRIKTVVCGATFGQAYLAGIEQLPESFELTGMLARGSAHAQDCARRRGVPLYRSVDELPADIELACVVVRAGIVGGAGGELAQALLARGVHVLQEHPLHAEELAACLHAAKRAGRQYRLNSFYPDVEPVANFIAAARRALAVRRPCYVDAACSVHVLYPLLDIIGRALGRLRPWSFQVHRVDGAAGPFTCVSGQLGGVPLTLRVQNQLDPRDPDNHTLLLHRIELGTTGGTLRLDDTHGHVIWHPRMHLERRGDGVLDLSSDAPSLALPTATLLGRAETASYADVFRRVWPDAIARALLRMRDNIVSGIAPTADNQYALSCCQVWQQLGALLGPSSPMSSGLGEPLAAGQLMAAEVGA
ncbi:Gfo/Idh/MocA family oxidoreductase [Chromobacterium sp. ATCC 53434]|uniref:Gfo/Idh/MocA family oxidoreductase n=1 Tax=Chromobacterium sp. (strain ATCC 53434 / SC 14030) TaxID=2059672 RepID=UPI0013052187|nr:Gfo/Idh/MocA family oxidoreductase [Chromobacterium sp. ATCC 53434]